MCVAIVADLVGSGVLEDVIRVVGVADRSFFYCSCRNKTYIYAELAGLDPAQCDRRRSHDEVT
jgi:hypothetical protein